MAKEKLNRKISISLIEYTIPYYGNKHATPYGKILVDGPIGERIVKFESDKFSQPSFIYNRKRYFMENVGSLYNPNYVLT